MHRSLLISEVAESIAEYLYDEDDVWTINRSGDPCSLLSLALTCRSLCDPALNVLWRDLHSPCPLAFAFQPGVTPVRAGHYESEEGSEDGDGEESDSEGSIVADKPAYVSWEAWFSPFLLKLPHRRCSDSLLCLEPLNGSVFTSTPKESGS